ncbi:hypothetical protein DFJ58DRAFT_716896 [Suillus subalutaceus]|uniref:uncharacterized protein n=1 Tax=Suillus subalutaceus TaxID=48586 RepID=UPI001B87BB81|nr:uncharacterized protein DFJ58DRAFT_716896 [Suillus subalutaceus]KAG1849671.1 hypothetical protein DFJ58DRAFT_716896 [Suillus subalutaceus]
MSVIETLFVTSLIILLGWLYIRKSTSFPIIVLLHSLYSLYALIQRSPNLFSRLRIPLTLPVDRIRSLLLSEAGFGAGAGDGGLAVSAQMPPDLELLLSRLKTDESRGWFVRFGQRALQTCAPCTSADDYALFVFAGALIAYVRTAAVLLLLTSNANGKDRWRGYVLGVLVCAALAEGYVLVSVSAAPLPKDGTRVFMWHDNIQFTRQALFLLLPILTHFLPEVQNPGPPSMSLAPALAHLERSIPRAHLLKYTRAAIMRNPELSERAVRWWSRKKREGDAGREDEAVQRAAQKMGLGFADAESGEEGKLRMSARMAIESLKGLFVTPVGP